MNPKYPVYIISKSRWESRLTSKTLETMKVPYRIVVEPQEWKEYARVIHRSKILTLPFSNLGQGSIPARNWIWEHSIQEGHEKHWILDDNIQWFFRLNNNMIRRFYTGTIFKIAEDFVDRYENIAFAGFHYRYFTPRKSYRPPFYLNTRVYSNLLIRNDLPYRWRGRYNEDTDLCIQALKDKWCTILFNAFLSGKITTLTMKGGNTDELYKDDGRLKMAQSLADQHPDVARVSFKWGRPQHHVDYSKFKKNKLKLKPGLEIPEGINEYGLVLRRVEEV